MAEPTAQAGADASDIGGTPFRVFNSQAEFDAFSAGIRQAAERKARNVSADERAQMDAMAAELEQRKQRDLEAAGNYDKAKQALESAAQARITAAEKKLERAQAVARKALIEEQIGTLALKHGAYDTDTIAALLSARVSLDDDYNVVISDGTKTLDGVTLEQAVVDLLKAKPHLAKASAGRGAGATGGASLATSLSSTPAVRELLGEIETVKAQIAKNPRDPGLAGRLLALKGQLTEAKAKSVTA